MLAECFTANQKLTKTDRRIPESPPSATGQTLLKLSNRKKL